VTKSLASVLLLFLLPIFVPNAVQADEQTDRRIAELEKRINSLPTPIQTHGDNGVLVFLFGVFCALWAQNTGRNAWLWFFLGLCFSVITVVVLLSKNSDDLARRRLKDEVSPLDV
jgi:hypothetical protein